MVGEGIPSHLVNPGLKRFAHFVCPLYLSSLKKNILGQIFGLGAVKAHPKKIKYALMVTRIENGSSLPDHRL